MTVPAAKRRPERHPRLRVVRPPVVIRVEVAVVDATPERREEAARQVRAWLRDRMG